MSSSRFNKQDFVDELKGNYRSRKPTPEERSEEQRQKQAAAWDLLYAPAYKAARSALQLRFRGHSAAKSPRRRLSEAECHDLAVDAVSQAYLNIHQAKSETDRSSIKPDILGWVVQIAHNLAVSYLRKEASLQRSHSKLEELTRNATQPGLFESEGNRYSGDHKNCLECLSSARKRLSETSKEIIRQIIDEGMSFGDIQQSTGEPEGTIKSRWHRAKKELNDKYLKEKGSHLKKLAGP